MNIKEKQLDLIPRNLESRYNIVATRLTKYRKEYIKLKKRQLNSPLSSVDTDKRLEELDKLTTELKSEALELYHAFPNQQRGSKQAEIIHFQPKS